MSVVLPTHSNERDDVVVLASGGLDSAILVAEMLRQGRRVHPIYVRFGLAWEPIEEAYLRRFLDTLTDPAPEPLTVLNAPIASVYGAHWSVSGDAVPDERTADDAVYLPGRNLLLLAQPSVWCALRGVHTIALGTLKGNPFPDGSPEFFDEFAALVQRGMGHALEVVDAVCRADKGRRARTGPRPRACSTRSRASIRREGATADSATSAPNGALRSRRCTSTTSRSTHDPDRVVRRDPV